MSVPKPARRRRRLIDEGEEVGTENPVVVARSSECESEDEGPPTENSESESAVDDSADQEDETEEGSETETEEGSETEETGSETEGYTDEEGLDEERQSGDGEEQPDKDKPDDDEDKRNPAYVPRKGAFYEHDYRRGAEVPEAEVTEELKPKKKLWQDEGKWIHDRYIDELQAPKSRQELIEIYGYDIRIADKPPEAPPRSIRRERGPKQHNFKDFIPRMAVIDTTEGGHDSVPNLGDDDFIQYRYPGSRNTHRNKGPGTDSRRGGRGGSGRRNYQSDDIETKNNKNRLVSTRGGHGGRVNVGVPENAKNAEYPSLVDSTRQGVYRENQSWRKEDSNDNIRDNSKSESEGTPKLYHGETDGVGYKNGNQDRFQQTQDIRRLDDSRVKNHSQYGFREERRDNFSQGRKRDGNFSTQAQQENWRSAQPESRDGPTRANDFVRSSRGGYNDFGNSRRKPQQPITGGNTGQGVGSSGDSGYYGNNKLGAKGFEQTPYQQQQAEVSGTASKEAKDYTNSSYKNPEVKSKPKNAPIFPAVSIASGGAGDSSPLPANSNSVVISNKENVQTINVTITSTTTEKKSYAKERRAKGISRAVDGAVLMAGGAEPQAVSVTPVASGPYQNLSTSGVHHMDLTSAPLAAGANHYSSMRQGMFAEPPPVSGAKLYNPAMPPPPFYPREHSGLAPNQHPTHTPAGAVQDPTHFTPALLPPATALPYGLPASNAGLALPPNVAGIQPNPALFQASSRPPVPSPIAPAPAVIAAPFLPTGMIYAGGARVPPPGAPAGFPLTLAYTSPPPQGAVPAAVVNTEPPPQAAPPGQHKKVYRGDITYYAPELQQPARTTQKRPKAAIPIINPQEVPGQRMKIKSEEMYLPETCAAFKNKNTSNSGVSMDNSHVDTPIGSTRATKAALEGHDTKTLFNSEKQLAQSNIALSQEVPVPPSATLQGAPVASSQCKTNVATPQAKFVPPVNHTDNMKASSSHDGSESKKLAIKTELSPGGPPVSSSTSSTASIGKNSDQSLCTAMQNFKMEDSSGRAEMSTSASGNSVMKQECEKSITSGNESSVA